MNPKILLILASMVIAGCNAESATPYWQVKQTGVNQLYMAHLDCENAPATGPFQNCQLSITDLLGNAVTPQKLLIDGGMPHHGHGLPTSPVLTELEQPGQYRIDGLKYNMPGAWLLGFQVNTEAGQDKIVFDFVI